MIGSDADRAGSQGARASTSTRSSSSEITGEGVDAAPSSDIAAWYQANPQRVQGAPLEQVREPIRQCC